MKTIEQRINNLVGQLEGVKKMLNKDKDCMDVLIQCKAVKSGVNSLMNQLIEKNMNDCLSNTSPKGRQRIKNLFIEITKN